MMTFSNELKHSVKEAVVFIEIYKNIDIYRFELASHHLRILKNKHVVELTRDGKNSLYSLTAEDFYSIIGVMERVK